MLDERGLKSLKSFSVVMLVVVSLTNILLVVQYLGYNIELVQGIKIEETTQFFSVSLLMVSIGGIFNMPRQLSQEAKDSLREKVRPLMAGNLIFIMYILFSIIVMKNIYFILSAFIMHGIYINVILISRALYSCGLNDTQRAWREVMNGTSYSIQETSLLWRFKIWVRPIKRLPFKERYLRPYNIFVFIFFLALFTSDRQRSIFDIIFLIIYVRGCFSILEYILGLYTSMVGVCTGVKEFQESSRRGRGSGVTITMGSRRTYWKVYITDFENKREIVYKTYRYPFIEDGDQVNVIHGIFSKEVISANGNKIE